MYYDGEHEDGEETLPHCINRLYKGEIRYYKDSLFLDVLVVDIEIGSLGLYCDYLTSGQIFFYKNGTIMVHKSEYYTVAKLNAKDLRFVKLWLLYNKI